MNVLGQLVLPGAPLGGLAPSTWTPAFGGAPAVQSVVGAQPTSVNVGALRVDTLEPVAGADVAVYAVAPDGSETLLGEGVSGGDGQILFEADPAPTTQILVYLFKATPGESGLRFPEASVKAIPNRTSAVTIPICPTGTDPLVCEVGEKQVIFAEEHAVQMEKWGAGRGFALRMSHARLRELPVRDARLERYFNYKSYGVADLGIPPTDWPDIARNEAQMARVLSTVPWPVFSGPAKKIGEYFKACTLAVPIIDGTDGAGLAPNDWRLYAPTWSDFFPRDDRQIRFDLAARWIINMKPVLGCIEHRIRKKAREIERSAKAFSTMGLITAMTLSPMLGPIGAASVMVTEGITHLQLVNDLKLSEEVEAGLAHSSMLDGTEINAKGLLAAVLSTYLATNLAERTDDMNPIVRSLIMEAVPDLATDVVDDLLAQVGLGADPIGGTIPVDAGAQSFAAFSAIGTTVVKLIAGWVRLQGIKEVQDFTGIMMGLRNLQEEVIPFYIWCMRTLFLDKFYEAVAEESGIDLDAERDIVAPLVEQAERAGVEVPASALAPSSTDAVVPAASTPGEKALAVGAIGGGALALAFAAGILS